MGLRDLYFQGFPTCREEAELTEVGDLLSAFGLH